MSLKFTILGCGNSAGVPTIGNYWGNCDPDEPKNRRTRPAAMIQSDDKTIVIDTGPDFKEQANRYDLGDVDAVLYTHAHSDHILGIDDLRIFKHRNKRNVKIYGNHETIAEIMRRFDYLFEQREHIYPKVVDEHIIEDDSFYKPINLAGIEFIAFEQNHGSRRSMGFRFGDLAYSTDVVSFDKKSLEALSGIKTWILDGAGYKMEHITVHMGLKQVYAANEIVQADKVYITHLSPAMDYATLCKELRDGYMPAYDGLSFDLAR